MTTITIDDATARALAEHAAAAGMSVEDYLRQHVSSGNGVDGVESVSPADVDLWLDEISEGLPSLPRLPQDLSRGEIYDGHD